MVYLSFSILLVLSTQFFPCACPSWNLELCPVPQPQSIVCEFSFLSYCFTFDFLYFLIFDSILSMAIWHVVILFFISLVEVQVGLPQVKLGKMQVSITIFFKPKLYSHCDTSAKLNALYLLIVTAKYSLVTKRITNCIISLLI